MWTQRTFLGLFLYSLLAGMAAADTSSLRWRGDGALGLRATDFRVSCGSVAFPCEGGGTSTLLYASLKAPRSVSMQVGYLNGGASRPQGINISVIGKTGVAPDLGVYGRFGTVLGRYSASLPPASYGDSSGITYGLGLSFELSRKASASFGLDNYDFRTATGEWRDVRTASLGLQWRY